MIKRKLTLGQVLAAAERAKSQVASWPRWKRELSAPVEAPSKKTPWRATVKLAWSVTMSLTKPEGVENG